MDPQSTITVLIVSNGGSRVVDRLVLPYGGRSALEIGPDGHIVNWTISASTNNIFLNCKEPPAVPAAELDTIRNELSTDLTELEQA